MHLLYQLQPLQKELTSTSGISPSLTDLLNLSANAHGSKQSKTSRTGRAHVLTSSEYLQTLEEKQEASTAGKELKNGNRL